MMRIIPINYDLKSKLEKESILNSYKLFLKTCNFDRKEDLNSYTNQIQEQINIEENEALKAFFKSYINFIHNQNKLRNSSSKNFYILVENSINDKEINYEQVKQMLNEKFFKIKDSLSRCR